MSAEFDALTRGFQHALDRWGVNITVGAVTKKCVTGAVEQKRLQEISGDLPQALTQADMFATDFAALGVLQDRKTILTINGINYIYLVVQGDEQDPCVHLILTKDV